MSEIYIKNTSILFLEVSIIRDSGFLFKFFLKSSKNLNSNNLLRYHIEGVVSGKFAGLGNYNYYSVFLSIFNQIINIQINGNFQETF